MYIAHVLDIRLAEFCDARDINRTRYRAGVELGRAFEVNNEGVVVCRLDETLDAFAYEGNDFVFEVAVHHVLGPLLGGDVEREMVCWCEDDIVVASAAFLLRHAFVGRDC